MLFTGLLQACDSTSPGAGADRSRLADESPGSSVLCCVQVGVLGMPAREAPELGPHPI